MRQASGWIKKGSRAEQSSVVFLHTVTTDNPQAQDRERQAIVERAGNIQKTTPSLRMSQEERHSKSTAASQIRRQWKSGDGHRLCLLASTVFTAELVLSYTWMGLEAYTTSTSSSASTSSPPSSALLCRRASPVDLPDRVHTSQV